MMEFSTLDILKLGGKRKRRRAFNSGTFEYYVSATFKKKFIYLAVSSLLWLTGSLMHHVGSFLVVDQLSSCSTWHLGS